jgi:hypothetical protein
VGDVGEDYKAMDQRKANQRARSHEAAVRDAEDAKRAAAELGLELTVANDSHHWQFRRGGKLLLSFWPTSAKAMRPAQRTFRCRGWKHALALAARLSRGVE